jgi:hypothetical protein
VAVAVSVVALLEEVLVAVDSVVDSVAADSPVEVLAVAGKAVETISSLLTQIDFFPVNIQIMYSFNKQTISATMKSFKLITILFLFQFGTNTSAYSQFGSLTGKILEAGAAIGAKKLGINELLKKPAAISTSFEDVDATNSKFPDLIVVKDVKPLYLLPKAVGGGFILCEGFFEMTNKSYCLKAGTFAPSKGDGYMYAPTLGPKKEIVITILKKCRKTS